MIKQTKKINRLSNVKMILTLLVMEEKKLGDGLLASRAHDLIQQAEFLMRAEMPFSNIYLHGLKYLVE